MRSAKNDDLNRTQKITSELSNEFSRKIIFSIISKAKPGMEIAKDTGLSQSTVYQKIAILRELSLVQASHKKITDKR